MCCIPTNGYIRNAFRATTNNQKIDTAAFERKRGKTDSRDSRADFKDISASSTQ